MKQNNDSDQNAIDFDLKQKTAFNGDDIPCFPI